MNKERLKKALPLAAMLVCAIAGYWVVIQKLLMRWNNGDDNYCYLIVPLFLYLCWEKKDGFRFQDLTWTPWGILPALFSAVLIFAGELGSVETLMYVGLWGCAASILFTLYGSRVRSLTFPLLILLFIVPLPPFVNRTLTFKLKMLASSLSVDLLRLVGVSVVQQGNIIDLGITRLEVADACSGLRYFMPMILMGFLVAHFFTRGIWRKTVVLLLVVPLTVVINVIRIFFAGIATVSGHPELAENLFHDFSGWLAFMAAGVFLVLVTSVLKRIGHYPDRTRDIPDQPLVHTFGRGFLLTNIAVCAVFLVSGLVVAEAATWNRTPARKSFDEFPMQIGQWQGTRSYISKEELQSLWADDYVSATFTMPGSRNVIHLLIPYYTYQGTRHTVHAPQSCLLGGGWSLLSSADENVAVPGRVIPVRTMSLVMGDHRLLGSYFFLQRGRVITDPWVNKWYLLQDSIGKRRTDGALVRVELLVGENVSQEDARGELHAFIAGLWPLLPAYVPD